MLFYEPLFLFVFLPVVFVLFWVVRPWPRGRLGVLLASSVLFYLWSEPRFVPIVLLSCVADYVIGFDVRRRPALLGVGIALNVALLAYYKYAVFAVANFDAVLDAAGLSGWHIGAIALPIGVSFIVFEKITYLVDIRRGASQPAPSFAAYLLYVFLFPKLLAGPIIKYHDLEAQLRSYGTRRTGDIPAGFQRFMLGVAKKTLLADPLGAGADMTFANAAPATLGCADAWAGVLFFTLQIYFDFSAYSDMAIGLARMFGFRLMENFNKPYLSRSITEFWRRWHISLSTWIRDYLYIPLGGNRVPLTRQYLNLWICFLASGLWHGAAWTYVLWGAYHGLFLVLERVFLRGWLGRAPDLVANAYAFLVVTLGWTLFRATSLQQAGVFLDAMVHPGRPGLATMIFRDASMTWTAIAAGLICAMPRLPGYTRIADWMLTTLTGQFMLQTAVALLFVLAEIKAIADPFKPFLYFRF
jgi:alginate O-acetyltransferase complex protein AlgI